MSFRYMETIIGPKFVVVIPCYNEEKYVGGVLDDLCQQSVQPDMVVVADCESEDQTVEVVKRYKDRLPLKIVTSPQRSPAAARNSAVLAVNCSPEDYLVFIDADIRLPADFLQKLHTASRKYPVDCISPKFRCDGKSLTYRLTMWHTNAYNRFATKVRHRAAGTGGVLIVRKGMHQYVGGFPEEAGIVADDMWYIARLNKAGASAHYAANIQAVNSSRRVRQDGHVRWFIAMRPDESLVAKMYGLLSHGGNRRAYGHYRQKSKV